MEDESSGSAVDSAQIFIRDVIGETTLELNLPETLIAESIHPVSKIVATIQPKPGSIRGRISDSSRKKRELIG